MSLSEFEHERIETLSAFLENIRPSPELRNQVDIGYRVEDQQVLIFEIHPVWNNPQEKMESPIAKATYVKTRKHWILYWHQADQK